MNRQSIINGLKALVHPQNGLEWGLFFIWTFLAHAAITILPQAPVLIGDLWQYAKGTWEAFFTRHALVVLCILIVGRIVPR